MSINNHLSSAQVVGIIVGTCVLFETAIYFYTQWTEKKRNRGICKAMFFPDANPTCKAHYTNRHGCTAKYCKFSHEETV